MDGADGPASRQFYSIPKITDYINSSEAVSQNSGKTQNTSHSQYGLDADDISYDHHCNSAERKNCPETNILSYISNNVIGSDKTFSSPYGLRTVVYLDYTASGRSLHFIEDYIQNEVLPEYANTHTTTSITSLQTTLFRHEARDVIRNSCNASEHDSVIFVGSGTTGAVHKLIHSLNLTNSPIVFVGPYEHHSNILPWMEIGAEVIRISATHSGKVDVQQLESFLSTFQPFGKKMIGVFSAASNVTGVVTDVDAISICLHKYGALAFWDYAAAAPYVKVDMNPYVGGADQELVYKDAVYFSVHKFVGGVGSPGVLIVKKKLLQNPVPHGCGGGTVFFVRRDHHRYLVEPEMKEEGGTPNIVGAIRAGMVFQLRDAVGTEVIAARDTDILSRVNQAWQDCPNLVLLGPDLRTTQRLPIISFMVYHTVTGYFLHHNFVTAVLNDLFGIQARGGCACAGPYAMDILGMSENASEKIEELLAEDSRLDRTHLRRVGEYSHREVIRPGFIRINLPYFLDSDSLDFIIQAVMMVSRHAWKLMPQYLFNPETGEWRNKNFQTFKDRKWLGHISYSSGRMSYHQPAQVIKGPLPTSHQDCLEKAREIILQAEKINSKIADQSVMFDDDARIYRWFLLPSEANACLQNKWKEKPLLPDKLPFCPPSLLQKLGHDVPNMESESDIKTKITKIVDRLAKIKESRVVSGEKNSEENFVSNVSDHDLLLTNGECVGAVTQTFRGDEKGNSKRAKSSQKGTNSNPLDFVTALDRGFVLDASGDRGGNNSSMNSEGDIVVNNRMSSRGDSAVENFSVSLITDEMASAELISHGNNESDKKFEDQDRVVLPESYENSSLKENLTFTMKKEKATNINLNKDNSDDNSPRGEDDLKDDNRSSTNDAGVQNKEFNSGWTSSKGDEKRQSNGWIPPPKIVFKPTVQALEEYNMLRDGDKVLVCLSGGKDSLSLLHTIRQYQFYAKKKGINFTFGAVTVDPQTPAYDPSPLKRYLAYLEVPYFYESQCIMETATNLPYECASICSFCSRMKRGRIYAAARREGYNVLALGQHLDDLAESFLMSFLHNGNLNTMKAHYTVKEGDLRVIRPFVYVRETELRSFAEQNKLPIIAENCPACFDAPKERHRTKQLLASQEVLFPQVYNSMMAAMKPLMARGRKSEKDGVTSSMVNAEKGEKDEDDDDLDL